METGATRETEIPEILRDVRLDKVLCTLFDLTRSEAKCAIESGLVKLDDSTITKTSYKVGSESKISIDFAKQTNSIAAVELPLDILYECDDFIIINKPPNLVTYPGAGKEDDSVLARILFRFPRQSRLAKEARFGILHRLDKNTSGVMVIARNIESYKSLRDQFKLRSVEKIYTVCVDGVLSEDSGQIVGRIGSTNSFGNKREITPSGKEAVTHFKVIKRYPSVQITLLSVKLETGRTHQIRVHFASISHPVLSDTTYGSPHPDLSRMFLHSSALTLNHPRTLQRMTFRADLAPDLASFIAKLDPDFDT